MSLDRAIVMESKQAVSLDDLAGKTRQALDQAMERDYVAAFRRTCHDVRVFGIACCNKECLALAWEWTTVFLVTTEIQWPFSLLFSLRHGTPPVSVCLITWSP